MGLFDWLTNRNKPLAKMDRQELRQQELLLEKERGQLLKRVEKLVKEKQTLFERGKAETTPEVRRMLAQEFELKTSEQLMIGRQLNIRTKEAMTVTRMRMLRENAERSKSLGDRVGMISERDMMALAKLIENDAVTTEMYQQRLDDILAIGAEVDQGEAGLSGAGEQVMDIWEKMDAGLITDADEGFNEADRRVREQQTPEKE